MSEMDQKVRFQHNRTHPTWVGRFRMDLILAERRGIPASVVGVPGSRAIQHAVGFPVLIVRPSPSFGVRAPPFLPRCACRRFSTVTPPLHRVDSFDAENATIGARLLVPILPRP